MILIARRYPSAQGFAYDVERVGKVIPGPAQVVTKNFRYPAPTFNALGPRCPSKVGTFTYVARPPARYAGFVKGIPSSGEREFDDIVVLPEATSGIKEAAPMLGLVALGVVALVLALKGY